MRPQDVPLGKTQRRSSFALVRRTSAKTLLHTLLWVLILMLTTPVLADSVSPYDLYDDPFEFTLTFSNNDIDLQDGDINYPATMDRISFSILSIDNEHIQWGFVAGSSYLSLDNDTALAGMNLNGYHAGFTLRGHAGTNPQLGLRGVYRYQETRNEFATQSATISWHELNIAATGKILLGQHLGLGLAWVFSDGETLTTR